MNSMSITRFLSHKVVVIEVAFLMLVALVVFTWSKGYYIKSIDSIFGLEPNFLTFTTSYIWKDYYSFGYPLADFNLHSFYTFQSLLKTLFGLVNSQIIILYIMLILSEIGTYALLREFFSDNSIQSVASRLGGSLFYTFNPYTLSWIFWRFMLYSVFYTFVPFALFLLYKTLVSRSWKLFFLGYVLYVFFILSIGVNLANLSNYLILMGIIFVISFYTTAQISVLELIKKFLIIIFLTMLLFFGILLPQYINIENVAKNVDALSAHSAEYYLDAASKRTTILNTFRLLGTYLLYESYLEDYYYSWITQFSHSKSLVFFSTLLPIFVFIPLIFINNLDKEKKIAVILFATLSLFFVFLMKGSQRPFGEVNKFFLNIHRIYFRHPYERFATLLSFSYTLLFSTTIYLLLTNRAKMKKSKILGYLFVLVFLIYYFGFYMRPFFTGEVIYGGGAVIPGDRIEIPSYYYELGDEFAHEKGFKRILIFPISYWGEASYYWKMGYHPNADPPTAYFVPNSSIVQFNSGMNSDKILMTSYELLKQGESDLFWKLLKIFSVNYIVIHEDWNGSPSIVKTLPQETWYSILNCPTTINLDNNEPIYVNFSLVDSKNYSLSISLFYFTPKELEGTYPPLVSIGYEKPIDGGIFLGLDVPSYAFVFGFKDKNGSWYQIKYSLKNILPNVWTNITGYMIVRTNTTFMEMIINGIKVDSLVVDSIPHFTKERIFIGYGGGEKLKNGKIGDLSVSIDDKKIYAPIKNTKVKCKHPVEYIKNIGKLKVIELEASMPIVRVLNSQEVIVAQLNETLLNNISLDYEEVHFDRINPTLWKVKVNATKPFMLSFAESYDPLWEARVYKDGKLVETVRSVPLYSVINGFWINETGDLDIVIRYKPQDWFELGLKISITTFILSVAYLFYDWRKSKGDKWAKRLENKLKKFLKNKLRLLKCPKRQ